MKKLTIFLNSKKGDDRKRDRALMLCARNENANVIMARSNMKSAYRIIQRRDSVVYSEYFPPLSAALFSREVTVSDRGGLSKIFRSHSVETAYVEKVRGFWS